MNTTDSIAEAEMKVINDEVKPSVKIKLVSIIDNFLTKYKWQTGLVLTLTLLFILCEIKHPYMFLQDDNRDLGLPNFVHAYRSLMSGELALFNFHQYLGTPFMAMGQWLVFYPFTYLSVFLSQLFTGRPDAAMDIFVIMHLLAGAVGFYTFLKGLGVKNHGAFFGAFLWPLNGFVFFISNSWAVIAFFAGLFPWIMYFTISLYKKFSWKCFIGLILMQSFYTGYVQLFLYGMVFEALTIIAVILIDTKKNKFISCLVKCKYFILANILAFIVSLPQFLPMFSQMNLSQNRGEAMLWNVYISLNNSFSEWWNSLMNSYPNSSNAFQGNVSFIGTVTLVLIIIAVINMLIRRKFLSFTFAFVILAAFALIWSIGDNPVGKFFYMLPIFNRFRWMFKIVFFVNFYLIALSAIGLQYFTEFLGKILSRLNKDKNFRNSAAKTITRAAAWIIIVIQLSQFSYLYIDKSYKSFRYHEDPLPLEEPLSNVLKDGRILSIGNDTRYAETLEAFNYATLFGLYHFAGYEPMVADDNYKASLGLQHIALYNNIENGLPSDYDWLKEWGVKWYIVQDEFARSTKISLPLAYTGFKREVYADNTAKPLFFRKSDETNTGIQSNIKTNSIELKVDSSKDDQICILFLYNSQFKATIDGKDTQISKDDYGRMLISVPQGQHSIVIKYTEPYMVIGFVIMLLTLGGTFTLYLLYKRRNNKFIVQEDSSVYTS